MLHTLLICISLSIITVQTLHGAASGTSPSTSPDDSHLSSMDVFDLIKAENDAKRMRGESDASTASTLSLLSAAASTTEAEPDLTDWDVIDPSVVALIPTDEIYRRGSQSSSGSSILPLAASLVLDAGILAIAESAAGHISRSLGAVVESTTYQVSRGVLSITLICAKSLVIVIYITTAGAVRWCCKKS